MPHIIPIKNLKDTVAISHLCNESNEPIYITKNGYGDMVIMSMKTYEKKLLITDVHTKLKETEAEIRNEKLIDALDALEELKVKYHL